MKPKLFLLVLVVFLIGCTSEKSLPEIDTTQDIEIEEEPTIEEYTIQSEDTPKLDEQTIAKNLNEDSINGADLSNVLQYFTAFKFIQVVGDSATADSVIGVSKVAVGMQDKMDVGPTLLASEVEELKTQNIMSVGNACENEITASFLNTPSNNCQEGTEKDKGYVRLVPNGDKLALLIYGHTSDDTLKTATFFSDLDLWKSGKLSNEFKVRITFEGDSTGEGDIPIGFKATCAECNLENFELFGTEVEIDTTNILIEDKNY